MYSASLAYKQALSSSIGEVYVKLELLDRYGNLLDEITQQVNADSVGDISVDKNRDIRRMFTLTLDNADGKYTWNPGSLIWIDQKYVKVFVGIKLSTGIEYVPVGTFVLTEPDATSKPGEQTVNISGQDKTYLLTGNLGKFKGVVTIEKGTPVDHAIKVIAEGGNVSEFLFDACDVVTPYSLTYQPGQNRWEAIKELAKMAFYDIFFDVNGYLRFQPYADPTKMAPTWSYQIAASTLYGGSIRKLRDTELYNAVLVLGGSSQTAAVSSYLAVDDTLPEYADSDFSIQEIGERCFFWNDGSPDPMIDSQTQADARAKYELKKRLSYSEEVAFDLAPNYLHEAGDVIEIVDEHNGCLGNYELQSFTIPIRPKLVTGQALKIVQVM